MLNATPFYFSTIRKLTVAIGTLFNNISIVRTDATGTPVKTIKVPLAYAPRMGYWAKLRETDVGGGNPSIQTTLPRMSFYFENPEYDMERQTNPMATHIVPNAGVSTAKKQYAPIPWNFRYNVSVFVENVEDGLQIIEQILPYFSPSYAFTVADIPSLGVSTDIPVSIESVTQEDNYQEGFSTNRLIAWNISLLAHGKMFMPANDAAVIKYTTTNFFGDQAMTKQLETMGIAVNPLTTNATDPHTIDTVITEYAPPA